jgi:hypothetical protein
MPDMNYLDICVLHGYNEIQYPDKYTTINLTQQLYPVLKVTQVSLSKLSHVRAKVKFKN